MCAHWLIPESRICLNVGQHLAIDWELLFFAHATMLTTYRLNCGTKAFQLSLSAWISSWRSFLSHYVDAPLNYQLKSIFYFTFLRSSSDYLKSYLFDRIALRLRDEAIGRDHSSVQ